VTPGAAAVAASLDGVAARCIEVLGTPPALDRPLVVECRTPNNMATGELPWSVAKRITTPGTETVLLDGPFDATALAARAAGRALVAVVRDPVRYPWQYALLDLAARHGAAVVVDVGWPADLPASVPAIRTRGIAPGLLDAAVGALAAQAVTGSTR
jgi:beta-N-acetylhexosaminidase